MSQPYIGLINNKKTLFVDDKPFFMVSGEIHNSSSSSTEFLEPIFIKLKKLNLNSVLLPVTWQQLEKEEGKFDFSLTDSIIDLADKYSLRLGILWFGTWKNAAMSYTPDWVKNDPVRFKRVELVKGDIEYDRKSLIMTMPFTTISPFSAECMHADAKAFRALMKHIKEYDTNNRVITVQVENETGYLGGDFDYSDIALAEYEKDVPKEFINYLKENEKYLDKKLKIDFNKTGTWEKLFKKNAHEVFTAFHISRYVEYVASEGKKEYNLPMGVNCWLDDKNMKPGKYPCGGPIAKMMEVWMYNAKSIDYYCPDNYLYEFNDILDAFNKHSNPIYVPESKTCSKAVERELYILGHYNGMCFATFGVEDIGNEPKIDLSRFAWMAGFSVDSHKSYPQDFDLYSQVNFLLNSSMAEFMKCYGTDNIECFSNEVNKHKSKWAKTFDNVLFETTMIPFIKPKDKATLIAKTGPDEFLILGYGTMSHFSSLDKNKKHLEYLSIEEGYYENGEFKTIRVLNGDEEHLIQFKPSLLKVRIHLY